MDLFQEVKEISSSKNNKYIHLVSVIVLIKKWTFPN